MIVWRMLLVILLFGVGAALIGCATTSTVSVEESEAAKSFEPLPDRGTVFLYRSGRAVGAASSIEVRVNTQTAGGTGPGTFFRWDLKSMM